MPYCPECGVEYRPGFAACSDCHAALMDEPVGGGASRLDGVSSASDAVFAVLYGMAGLFCFVISFIMVAGDPGPNARPDPRPLGFWFLAGHMLLIVGLLLVGLRTRRNTRA